MDAAQFNARISARHPGLPAVGSTVAITGGSFTGERGTVTGYGESTAPNGRGVVALVVVQTIGGERFPFADNVVPATIARPVFPSPRACTNYVRSILRDWKVVDHFTVSTTRCTNGYLVRIDSADRTVDGIAAFLCHPASPAVMATATSALESVGFIVDTTRAGEWASLSTGADLP